MRKVFEACGGSRLIGTPLPPAAPLIQCLELKAVAYSVRIGTANDKDKRNFMKAKEAYRDAIGIADENTSTRSGAMLRVKLGCLIAKHCVNHEQVKIEVGPMLDWIIGHEVKFDDLVTQARELKEKISDEFRMREIKEVVAAMSNSGGYNYGGAASSHWYECPNGHPFFIGDCGGAMHESRCFECGERIGGTDHVLLRSNRQVTGRVREALRET